MLQIVEEMAEFHSMYKKKEHPILIYGTALDGRTLGTYLRAKQMNLVGYIAGTVEKERLLNGVPVNKIEEIDCSKEYYVLLTAKTDVAKMQMLDAIEQSKIKGVVFTWKSFCYEYNHDSKRKVMPEEYAESVPWMYYSIYGERANKEDIKSLYKPHIVSRNILYNSRGKHGELHSIYWNIDSEGRRKTCYQPNARQKIHIFGNSRILGIGVEDAHTIPSQLQRMIGEKMPQAYRVENYGLSSGTLYEFYEWIQDIEIGSGDIVVVAAEILRIASCNEAICHKIEKCEYEKYLCNSIYSYCKAKGALCYFISLPGSYALTVNTLAEKSWRELQENQWAEGENEKKIVLDYKELVPWGQKYLEGKIFDLAYVVEKNHLKMNFFIDRGHYSPEGNRLVAEELYSILFETGEYKADVETCAELDAYFAKNRIQRKYPFIWNPEWREYESYLCANKRPGTAGAIVMNANPFTKGHQYLVEYAASQVDALYLFVLQEDRSEVSFEDRFCMVQQGVKDVKNVVVLRSGSFIISNQTFNEYFELRDYDFGQEEDGRIDCSRDLGIFAELIAPVLDIKYRFVGKEPYSGITRIYNEQMKDFLPKYGIECIEIERVALEGENFISATKARKAWVERDMEILEAMLPETTLNYMQKNQIVLRVKQNLAEKQALVEGEWKKNNTTCEFICFGAGNKGKEYMANTTLPISKVIDNDERKAGTKIGSAEIIPAKAVSDWRNYFVIVTCVETEAIEQQLTGLGLVKNKDFVLAKEYL